MDDIDTLITGILTSVSASKLTEAEKADVLAQLTVGMHRFVWPILLSHVPQYLLDEAVNAPNQFTLGDYAEMIDIALKNPSTAKEIHTELKGALEEVRMLLEKSL